jgi:putative tryptophan/tyrosine transport system substrate-binding protein
MARAVSILVGVTLLLASAPRLGMAQQSTKPPLVGILAATSETFAAPYVAAGRKAIRDLGYVEGQNVTAEIRYAGGRTEKIPELVNELVALNPKAIVVVGDIALRAVKQAGVTTPVVFVSAGDPVAAGLVGSLARPGSNFTGLASILPELNGKQTALLKEAVPRLSRLAVLWNPNSHGGGLGLREIQRAAQALGLTIHSAEARTVAELDAVLAAITNQRADGMLVITDPLTFGQRQRVIDFATRHRIPTMFEVREFVDAGALLSYGPSLLAMVKRSAVFVDKILKGAKPADIPVEQPTTFELVVNMRTAKALGLTIPPSLLARADEIIE